MNPYIFQLYDSLQKQDSSISILHYKTKNLFKKIDICHYHWPESVLGETKPLKIMRLIFKFFIELYFLKAKNVKIIWTVHNLRAHGRKETSIIEKIFYLLWINSLDGLIFLSHASKDEFFSRFPVNKKYSIIPHGDYRDVYKNVTSSNKFREKFKIQDSDFVIGHFGIIREYKNIPNLIKSFKELKKSNLKLIIAGGVTKARIDEANCIEKLARKDSRIHIHFAFLENDEIHELYSLTDLTIFPYKDIVNSGSALLSLSFNCPTLLPNNKYMEELRSKINANKVFLYEGEFSADKINEILDNENFMQSRKSEIDIKIPNWETLGLNTYNFFKSIAN